MKRGRLERLFRSHREMNLPVPKFYEYARYLGISFDKASKFLKSKGVV